MSNLTVNWLFEVIKLMQGHFHTISRFWSQSKVMISTVVVCFSWGNPVGLCFRQKQNQKIDISMVFPFTPHPKTIRKHQIQIISALSHGLGCLCHVFMLKKLILADISLPNFSTLLPTSNIQYHSGSNWHIVVSIICWDAVLLIKLLGAAKAQEAERVIH